MAHHGRRRDTPHPAPLVHHRRPTRRQSSPPSSDSDYTDDERDDSRRAALGPPLSSVDEHGYAHPTALAVLEGRGQRPNPRDPDVVRAARTGTWAGLGVGRMPATWEAFEAAHHRDLALRPLRSRDGLHGGDGRSASAPPRSPRGGGRGGGAHGPLVSAFSFSSAGSPPASPRRESDPNGTRWYSSADEGAWSDGEATASPHRQHFRLPSIQPTSPLLVNFPPSPPRPQVFRNDRLGRSRSNAQVPVPMNLDAIVSDSSPERTRTDAPRSRREH